MIIFRIMMLLCLITSSFSAHAAPQTSPQIEFKEEGVVYIPVRGDVNAVVYERGPRTWIIQNTPQFWPKDPLIELDAKVYYQEHISAISFLTPQGQRPHVKFVKNGIELSFSKDAEEKTNVPEYKKQPISGNIEFVLPREDKPSNPITFKDPDHKDSLILVPFKTDRYGVSKSVKFVDFNVLKSAVGLSLKPEIDTLFVDSKRGSILVSSEEGLRLAFTEPHEAFIPLPTPLQKEQPEKEPVLAEAKVAPMTVEAPPQAEADTETQEPVQAALKPSQDDILMLEPFLRVEDWETNIPFVDRQNELQEAVYNRTSGKFREEEAYNLARFYITYGMGREAIDILEGITAKLPERENTARHKGLKALAYLLEDKFYEANKLILDPSLSSDPRIVTWRWVANFLQKVEEGDKTEVLPGTVRINHLPSDLKYAVLSRLMKNALRVQNFDSYTSLSELARFHTQRPAQRFYLTYLDGWHNYLIDQTDTAFDIWEFVAENGDRLNAVQARYAYVYKGIEAARLTRAEVLQELEYLTYAWRGDDFEHKTRYLLAKMNLEDHHIREALTQFKALIMRFPSHPQAAEITTRMTEAFTDFMLVKSVNMSPIDVVAMFEEFKELTPIGEKGDEIYFRVANLYLDLSLPDEAEPILQHLTKFKLQGEQKANAGLKLCSIYVDKAKWDSALTALTTSEAENVPEAVVCERDELRAEILLNQEHYDHVLKMLSDKTDPASQRLKARAHSGLNDWGSAQKIYEDLLRALPEGEPLSLESQHDVLSYVISLVFEKDFDTLKVVNEKYGEDMHKGKFGQAFDLVSSSISADKIVDLAKDVTELTELYQQYKSKYLS